MDSGPKKPQDKNKFDEKGKESTAIGREIKTSLLSKMGRAGEKERSSKKEGILPRKKTVRKSKEKSQPPSTLP